MDERGPTPRVVLDVEDDEQRQARIQSYLEKINSSAQPTRAFDNPIPQFDFGDRTTFPVKPNSELLSRVQAFLPQMEASNTMLSQRMQDDPASVDIEHIPEGMDQYIEMNLGLGVFEDRSHTTEDSEMSTSSSSDDSSDSSDKAQEEDDSDLDSDASSLIITSFVPARPIKPLPKRANKPRPEIIVLDENKH
ncbi:hypothetical protein M413DRAFT_446076 [Hebeloma cylindrosporum]|uniref:Uncharacterized protein n=1 Tax=Hebeloma cylindrosporum TaxID=76867 RepID=A0A0C3C8X7_HEBCY|nr:hypothetical protein M413DRAFT_446076 [Hebeloma cylindrosporum h7]